MVVGAKSSERSLQARADAPCTTDRTDICWVKLFLILNLHFLALRLLQFVSGSYDVF